MPPTVLVTGFGPWGAHDENPTALVLERLRTRRDIVTLPLPVDSAAIDDDVIRAFDEHAPQIWLGLGLAMGSATIAVERVAVNIRDFAEPDIAGVRLSGVPVVEGGPAAYLATVPGPVIVERLKAGGIPARVSNSASTFLCNQLMYRVLHEIAVRGAPTRAGFLHVPAHPALVARQNGKAAEQPSMHLDTITAAVEMAIETMRLG